MSLGREINMCSSSRLFPSRTNGEMSPTSPRSTCARTASSSPPSRFLPTARKRRGAHQQQRRQHHQRDRQRSGGEAFAQATQQRQGNGGAGGRVAADLAERLIPSVCVCRTSSDPPGKKRSLLTEEEHRCNTMGGAPRWTVELNAAFKRRVGGEPPMYCNTSSTLL